MHYGLTGSLVRREIIIFGESSTVDSNHAAWLRSSSYSLRATVTDETLKTKIRSYRAILHITYNNYIFVVDITNNNCIFVLTKPHKLHLRLMTLQEM